jgi:hypothetical protein
MYCGPRLKYATSDPEIMAEQKRRIATTTMLIRAPMVMGIKIASSKMVKNAGSKSGVKS